MRGQELCMCVVCPSEAAAGKLLNFQLRLSEPPSIFDRGLRFSSPREADSFTSARKCQTSGQIRGKTRGLFLFSRLNPGKRHSPCVFD